MNSELKMEGSTAALKAGQTSIDYSAASLVERFVIGATIDDLSVIEGKEHEEERPQDSTRLPTHHPFSWESISADPKGEHPHLEERGSWYKTMQYHILHTGGFVRLCTIRGRAYWNAQNEATHRTPDWKLHFSTLVADIPKAWNILAALFIRMKCDIGMKATYLDAETWSDQQRGREITVYIYKYDNSFKGYMQGVEPEKDHEFYLGKEHNTIYNTCFWYKFITEAEKLLSLAGVRSNGGVASGDLGLPACNYASLRNEAFVLCVPPPKNSHNTAVSSNSSNSSSSGSTKTTTATTTTTTTPRTFVKYIYPPNDAGWNAAEQRNPFLDVLFFLQERHTLLQSLTPVQVNNNNSTSYQTMTCKTVNY